MKALIVTGGDCPSSEFLLVLAARTDLVIAADSGLDACLAASLRPDFVVGDFDSVHSGSLNLVPPDRVLRYPEDKDYTDTELAINVAREHGGRDIVLAGGGAGRLDHLLAVRALFEREEPIREWHTGRESVFYFPSASTMRFSAPQSIIVSLFPLSDGARGMRSSGLKWPLEGLQWDSGHFGVSNKSIAQEISIYSGENPVLVILPLETEVSISAGC